MTDYPPVSITRTFNVPRQAVWDAWTTPDQFSQWFMPAPFTVDSCEFDLRVGGKLKVDTKSPDGTIIPMTGEYTVLNEPSKLVMKNALHDAEGNQLFQVEQAIDLSEEDGKTTLTIISTVLSAGPNAEQFLMGMKPGLEQALSQMAEMLEA